MARRQNASELIETAKLYAPNNKLIQDALKKQYHAESRLAQANFLKKQNEAELRKLLRMTPPERNAHARKCDGGRPFKKDFAKVKNVHSFQRPTVSDANVEVHRIESDCAIEDAKECTFSEGSAHPNVVGKELHFNLDVEGQSEVDRLRQEVTYLTRENYRLSSLLAGDTVAAANLRDMNAQKDKIMKCKECENLSRKLESSETNLLRSERHILQMEKTVGELRQQLNLLQTNAKKAQLSPKSVVFESRSPASADTRIGKTVHIPHHINRYCAACHRLKKNTYNHKVSRQRIQGTRPLYSRPVSPDPKNANLLSNFITEEYDRLLSENENLNRKYRQLQERNDAVEALLDQSKQLNAPALACPRCLDLKKQHESLKRTHRSLLDRFETEQSRHKANCVLLDGQKKKLQLDLEKVKQDSDYLLETNKKLRHDLVVAEGCALELQKLLAEKCSTTGFSSDKTSSADKASDTSDLPMQNNSGTNGQSASEWGSYMSNIENRDVEINRLKRLVEQMEIEYGKFRAQIKNQEDDLHRMTKALESATDARKQAECNRDSVEVDLIRHKSDYARLQAAVKSLEDQLRKALMDKEYWQSALRNSIAQLREFESLMRQKEAEYERELKSAKATTSDGRRASDLEISNIEKRNLLKEIDFYREQFGKTSKLLQEMEVDRESMQKQNESFQRDVASLRQSVLVLEADKVHLLQKLAVKSAESAERKRQVENLNVELGVFKSQTENKSRR